MFLNLSQQYYQFVHSMLAPQDNVRGSTVSVHQAILLSWPFIIIGSMAKIAFSILIFVDMAKDKTPLHFPFLNVGSLVTIPMLFALFFALWGIILFPLRAWVWAWILKTVIIMYQRLTHTYAKDPTLGEDLAASALSANVFRFIPILGDMAQTVGQYLCLFRGLKFRMGINSLAAMSILLTPALLTILLVFGMIYSLFLLISLMA